MDVVRSGLAWLGLITVVASAPATAAPAPKPRWQTLPPPAQMPAPTATGVVTVDGAKIFYETFGDAKATPVILLHGGLGNSDQWGNQLPALADKFAVIAIDSRAQGRSTRTQAKMTYDLMAGDVIAVMDQLKIPRASVVGWSDGGEVAIKLGIAHPDRVDRLFVWGVNYNADGSKSRGSHTPTFAAYSALCKTQYTQLAHPAKPQQAWDELVDALLPLWREPIGVTKDQLRTIAAPTMLADGDHDEVIVLDQVVEMAQLIPHGELKVFADASHFVHWQDPTDFNAALVDFLTRAK